MSSKKKRCGQHLKQAVSGKGVDLDLIVRRNLASSLHQVLAAFRRENAIMKRKLAAWRSKQDRRIDCLLLDSGRVHDQEACDKLRRSLFVALQQVCPLDLAETLRDTLWTAEDPHADVWPPGTLDDLADLLRNNGFGPTEPEHAA